MSSLYDFPDVAIRILQFQLAWLRGTGMVTVVIAALAATGVAACVMRLLTANRNTRA